MKIIITAGGQGTKLWPYSRESKPKQFQPILGHKSTFATLAEDLLTKFAPEDIFISTKQAFIKHASDQAPQIPLRNYIVEPNIARDRGPADGLAVLTLSMLHPDEPFMIIQSDTYSHPAELFLKMVQDAGKIVERDKKLVTGGLKVVEANMGIDYLRLGQRLHQDTGQEVYEIDDFIERGSSHQATKELLERYDVMGHANHCCWYPDLFLDCYKQYQPGWHKSLMEIRDAIGKPGADAEIARIYAGMEKAPTEKATIHAIREGRVILLPFRWTDFGTWGAMYEHFSKEPGEVFSDGNIVSIDSSDSLVKVSNPSKLVAIAGIDNLVVVDTEDALLIIPKNKIEKIKDIQKQLSEHPTDKNYL